MEIDFVELGICTTRSHYLCDPDVALGAWHKDRTSQYHRCLHMPQSSTPELHDESKVYRMLRNSESQII